MKKVMLIPLDERPCNYNYANVMLEGNQDIELLMPPLSILGNKKEPANFEQLNEFILTNVGDCYGLILSIDMLLYGGIVPSRIHYFTQEELIERLNVIKQIKEINPNIIIYSFALIMRCPQYSSSDEEPDYYEDCGYSIFKYGELKHKIELGIATVSEIEQLNIHYEKCKEFYLDYVNRREINSDLNIEVVKLLKNGDLDFLVIPQDDSSPYGLIKKDQEKIFNQIQEMGLAESVLIYPGADEVGMVLTARIINHINNQKPRIYVEYGTEHGHLFVPMFEDREVYLSVEKQILSAGCIVCNDINQADGILMVNNPTLEMDDPNITHDFYQAIKDDKRDIKGFVLKAKKYINQGYKVSIADVSICNMGDIELVVEIAKENIYFDLAGYSGWNTSSNTLGTAITHLVININYGYTKALEKHLALRIFEDIGYCGHTRKYMCDNILPQLGLNYFNSGAIRGQVSEKVHEEIERRINEVMPAVTEKYAILDCYMPWHRMFEVALTVKKKIRGAI